MLGLVLLFSLLIGLGRVYFAPFENVQVCRSIDGSYEISYTNGCQCFQIDKDQLPALAIVYAV